MLRSKMEIVLAIGIDATCLAANAEQVAPFEFVCPRMETTGPNIVRVLWDGTGYSIRAKSAQADYLIFDIADLLGPYEASQTAGLASWSFKGHETFTWPDSIPSESTLSAVDIIPRDEDGEFMIRLYRAELTADGYLTDANQAELDPCIKKK
ncbi:hypothetical protein [Achromobacter animicus]|uniref:hypothetical protein n=1 Tax=Achromobacter animicus TaxID=1389935 RepID=UPI0028A82A03|nr:hypothetical protein [Achromobacter animicus]